MKNPFSATFDKETFLNESSHFSSASHPFINAVISSQVITPNMDAAAIALVFRGVVVSI